MLSREQRAEFEERGCVCLPGAVDAAVASALRERVLAFIAERALCGTVTPSATAPLIKTWAFEDVWGARVIAAIDRIVGPGAWQRPKFAGQLLPVSHPTTGAEWALPHKSWHLDYMAPGAAERIPGVQVFLCLDRLEARGGATLGVAGSHRLIDDLRRRRGPRWDGRSADARQSLQREVPWLRELGSLRPGEDRVARFMAKSTRVGAVPLQVAEFTGEPGDVIAMHPWLLHAGSPNCGTRPRLALTERIRLE